MKFIKQYWAVLTLIFFISFAVFVKNTGKSFFRYDAVKHAIPSVTGKNLISQDQLGSLSGELLVINLDKKQIISGTKYNQMNIPPDSILKKPNRKMIFKHKGSIILSSEDRSSSAAVWMVLSQMGLDKVYILN